ncbi:MAG: type II toxin-antitoxin system HipA family toxin [Myxococcaceae bacterium]
MNNCLVCLSEISFSSDVQYHPKCARQLFGVLKPPSLDIELAKLHTFALSMVGHTSLSGVQRKISLGLSADRSHFKVATEGGSYILKPQAQTYPSLPENEHVTMCMARLAGIEVPPFGLVKLQDDSLAYLVRRFDRPEQGGKRLVDDFCQLALKAPKEKYQGSAELLARLTLRYAKEPLIETLRLFRLIVFVWWSGNGDMHLKNFSLLRDDDGTYRLSPAYDLLCTRLVIADDTLALPVEGNKKDITRRQWMAFSEHCKLPEPAAKRVIREVGESHMAAVGLIERSPLPDEMKRDYVALLESRTKQLETAAA